MARYEHLPIWRDAVRLVTVIEEAVRGFPRYHKYALGADLRRQAMGVCWLVIRAAGMQYIPPKLNAVGHRPTYGNRMISNDARPTIEEIRL